MFVHIFGTGTTGYISVSKTKSYKTNCPRMHVCLILVCSTLAKSISPFARASWNSESCSNFASNWQEAFEQIVVDMIKPYAEKYTYPICITGGCALNVIINEKIKEKVSFIK